MVIARKKKNLTQKERPQSAQVRTHIERLLNELPENQLIAIAKRPSKTETRKLARDLAITKGLQIDVKTSRKDSRKTAIQKATTKRLAKRPQAKRKSEGNRKEIRVPTKLFVDSLPWATTDNELRQAFQKFGSVTEAYVVIDRKTRKSLGFGFVSFDRKEDAQTAIRQMDGTKLKGRVIVVKLAIAKQSELLRLRKPQADQSYSPNIELFTASMMGIPNGAAGPVRQTRKQTQSSRVSEPRRGRLPNSPDRPINDYLRPMNEEYGMPEYDLE